MSTRTTEAGPTRETLDPLPYLRLRPIQARYYGPTNHRGARIRLRDLRSIIETDVWLDRDYEDTPFEQARRFLEEMGWPIDGHLVADGRQLPEDIFLTRAFTIDRWTDEQGERLTAQSYSIRRRGGSEQ